MKLQEVIDYVLHTPGNTNPAILKELISRWGELQTYVKDLNITQITDFLYAATYTSWDYKVGREFLEKYKPQVGACSSVRNGDFYGRNYDWFFNNQREFIVRCMPYADRHGSIGVAPAPMAVQPPLILAGKYDEIFEAIPMMTVDGINDAGVCCNTNVVPVGDKGYTTGTHPGKGDMCALMMVRVILDYANSARHAIDLFEKYNMFGIYGDEIAEELHFEIADATGTYIVEFINNEKHVMSNLADEFDNIPLNKPIMTNFFLTGFDGIPKTGFEVGGISPEETTLTPHAAGAERYEILKNGYDSIQDVDSTFALMKSVRYTKMYDETTNPFWYSELVGVYPTYGDLTVYDDKSKFENVKQIAIERFRNRTREAADTWHTVHTSIYDLPNKKLYLWCQEEDEMYEADFENLPGDEITIWDGGKADGTWD